MYEFDSNWIMYWISVGIIVAAVYLGFEWEYVDINTLVLAIIIAIVWPFALAFMIGKWWANR